MKVEQESRAGSGMSDSGKAEEGNGFVFIVHLVPSPTPKCNQPAGLPDEQEEN